MKKQYQIFLLLIICLFLFNGCGAEAFRKESPNTSNETSVSMEYLQGENIESSIHSGESIYQENSENSTELSPLESQIIYPEGKTLEERFSVPEGYTRTFAETESLTDFLRTYSLKEHGSPILLHNGKEKLNQSSHAAVFTLPIENADLQQCADSIIRIFAEYYWNSGQYEKIAFHFTNGFLCEYSKWIEGYRVAVSGNDVRWEKSADYDASYETFVKYLRMVFNYAGTLSMEAYESKVISFDDLEVGDVILKGGSPGHVVMVVDICKDQAGQKAFLLAQGYMPAQEFHVLNNPLHEKDPWYYEEEMTFPLKTAEYTFSDKDMIRRLKW